MSHIYIRLDAGLDTNGNRRRLSVILDKDGDVVDALDEGCVGDSVVQKKYGKIPGGATFKVTPKEYRETLKRWCLLRGR